MQGGKMNKSNNNNQIKRITKDEGKEIGRIDKKVFFEYENTICKIYSK